MTGTNPTNRIALLCGASFLSLAALAGPTMASAQTATPEAQQDADEDADQVDEVVVTGIRASLASAQAIKQNSEQFVDSITAVDIGRLPDVNVAEALQRVSGIQITRNYGEGSGIAIRGLTNVRSELNGRDIFSASGGRGLSWEEVGSDLLAGVDVYKNPSAELIEGGLGGTINLRTRLPFDAPGRVLSASGSYTSYDLVDDDGYSGSFLASDRWQTGMGEFGALLNMSYGDTSFRRDFVGVEPFLRRNDVPGQNGADVFVPNGGGFNVGFGNRQRVSYAGALQWRPTDTVEIYLQALRTEYTFNDQGFSYYLYGGNTPLTIDPSVPFTFDDDGLAISGAFLNPGGDSVTYGSDRQTDTTDISFGGKWQINDRIQVTGDLQYIKSNLTQQQINLTASTKSIADTPTYDDDNDPATPNVPIFPGSYSFGFDLANEIPAYGASNGYLADPANYGLTAILPYAEDNEAESWAGRVDLIWDFSDGGFFRDFRAGVRATDRTAVNRSTTYGTWTAIGSTCASWSSDAGCYRLSEVPDQATLNPFTESFLYGEGRNVFGPVWLFGQNLARDPQGAFDFIRNTTGQEIGFRSFDDPSAQVSNISEQTLAAYGVLRFSSDFMGMAWDGNVGVRVVQTKSSSDGLQALTYRDPSFVPGNDPVTGQPLQPPTLTVLSPISVEKEYTEALPSLNLRLHITDKLQARFAASRNLSRPDFGQLNSQISLSPTYPQNSTSPLPDPTTPGTANAPGNPNLGPQFVNAFDASLEWYFSSVGFVYGTVFKKDIEDLIAIQQVTETYNLPGLGDQQFNIQRFVNVDKGSLEGFEIGGQRFFDFLPAPFDGLGLQANYTYIKSNAATIAANDLVGGTAITVPIQGLSKNSYNLVLLYEKYGFNGRIAYNWRDDYLDTVTGVGTGSLPLFAKPYGSLDASLSYDVNPNVAITIDAQNITREAFQTYQLTESRQRLYQQDDRRFSVRLRVRY